MRKSPAVVLVLFLCICCGRLSAQSLQNTSWKFYVDELHDTLTMHLGVDTSVTKSTSGETIIRSHYTVSKDTFRMKDIDGEYPCMDGEGVYRYTVEGDYMTFHLIVDPCVNRSAALKDSHFLKVQ